MYQPAIGATMTTDQMNQRIRKILANIEKRRDAKISLCESCDATGMYDGSVCTDCLGQKILLTREEYDTLLGLSDSILDAEIIT